MSNLRKLLEKRVEPKTVVVEHDGETYTVAGMPDNYLLNIKLTDPGKLELLAKQYTNMAKERGTDAKYGAEDVFQILLVDRYLAPDEEGQKPTDIEVAFVAKEHGPLFMKLFAAVDQIVSGRDEAKVGEHVIDDMGTTVGLGNSSGEPPKDETSSSSVTSPVAVDTQKKS